MIRSAKSLLPVLAFWALVTPVVQAAVPWRDAIVEMSDGRTIAGQVYVTQDRLTIYNEAQKRHVSVGVSDIRKVETLIEKEEMERKWIFLQDGRDEKFYTDQTYPARYFNARVTFHDGSTMTGHISSRSVFVRTEGGTVRLMLRRKLQGEVGEGLADLVYLKTLTFTAAKGKGTVGTISGRVKLPAGERLLAVKAIHLQHDFVAAAQISAGGGFRIVQCTGGTYDLIVVSDKTIYVYFSREKDKDAARLHAGVLDEIRNWAKLVRDFFHLQEPVYGAGNKDRAYMLVRKERHGGMTAAGGARLLRRYDVWLMHKPRGQWQIKKRFYISREQTPDAHDPRESIAVCPRLGGHVVDAEHRRLNLALDLKRKDEPAVPPPPAKETKPDGK